jgi:Tol biopolymer transport system component
MKTLHLSIILVFVIPFCSGLSIENAFATVQDSMKQYIVTLDKKEYSLYYNATNAIVDKITLINGSMGTGNSIMLNMTTGKYSELTLLIPNEIVDSYLIGSQCDPNSGMLSVLVDNSEIIPMVNFTNNYLALTITPLPTNSRNVMIFETIVGGPGPMSSLFGIPDSIKANPDQQVHLGGIVEDLCGRSELFHNTINLNFTKQISIKNQTVSTNDSKFTLDFKVPEDVKPGIYDALFSWQFYERQPLHLFVEDENAIPVRNSTATKIVGIDTLARLSGLDLYNKDHYTTINFYGFDWSSDGKFLYALVNLAPNYSIWKINVEDNTITRVKIPHDIEGYPYDILRIHDDKILFATAKYNPAGSLLYIYKFDIGNNSLTQSQITSFDPLSALAFTSDGNLIYEQDVGGRISDSHDIILWLVDSDGHKLKKIYEGTRQFFRVDPSPDGKSLVSRDLGLKVFDIKDAAFKDVPSTSNAEWPKWSPNNQFVVYSSIGLGGSSLILADAISNATEIVYDTTYGIQHPSISPDGRSIAFGINYDGGGRSTTVSGIYLVKLATPIPEFPFAIPVLLISITSLIVFYRMKFRK